MYLSKVKIFGFKSFGRKSELMFDEGVTCIVGPNGCGKTNIVDAIRWVLGEQKISTLRSEKMENVIFNGSENRKPFGMAEVALVLQNNKNLLPIEYSEVEVKRRIFRSGESEYFLNNVPCRLKDITDLFMDTGIGAEAYSVIELNMVEEILSDKLEDRRKLFDEAAGITKYKKRRSETFRKLESTRQDLLRVNDIIIEIERKVNSLKRQAVKVRKYQRLKTELKTKESEIFRNEIFNIRQNKETLIKNINGLKSVQEILEGELIKEEAYIESLKTNMIEYENKLSDAQREYNNIVDILNNQQMSLALAKEKKRTLQENIKNIEVEEIEIKNKINENEIRYLENKEKLNILKEKIENLHNEQKVSEEELNEFYKDYYDKKNRLSTAQTKIVELIRSYSEKSAKLDKAISDLRQKEEKITSVVKESKWVRERLVNKEKILESLITERKKEEDFLEIKKSERLKMQNDLEAKKVMINELKEKVINLRNLIEIDEKKIEFIHQIISEKGKLSEGTEYLLRTRDTVDGLIGTVSELIHIKKEYKNAVMSALKQTSNFLVFDSKENALKAIKLMSEKKCGGVNIIPLDWISNINLNLRKNINLSKDKLIGWAVDFIKCDEKIKNLAEFLLFDVLIVKDNVFEKEFENVISENKINLVDLSGVMMDRFGFIHTVGDDVDSEVSEKFSEIEKLKIEIDKTSKDIKELENLKRDYVNQVEILSENLGLISYEIASSEKRLREIENEISISDFEVKKDKEHLAKMEKERKQLEIFIIDKEAIEKQKSELKIIKEEQTKLLVEIEKTKLQESQLEQKRKELEGVVYDKSLRLIKFQEEFKGVESEFARNVELDKECRNKINLGKELIEKLYEEIKDCVEKVDLSQNKIDELFKSKSEFEENVNQIRTVQAELKNELFEKEKNLKEKRFQKERRANDIFNFELELSKQEQQEKTLLEKLDGISIEITELDRMDGAEIEIKKREIEGLTKKLESFGPVNFTALNEYQIEKERYDNLVNQRSDIIEAEKTLMETIHKINKTASEKFKETFDKIRVNFKDVFVKFFENGEADLMLSDESDLLESKIMVVSKPFGKKLQSISLLSAGEKALTAIALLMAIYLVKPSPFCILDEVDAPLDDANIDRFIDVIKQFSKNTQFILVTHNKKSMESAKYIYGITMEENGISKIVSTKFN